MLNPEDSHLAPWEHWTSHFPALPEVSVQTDERTLTMRYTFGTSLPSHLPVLFQTLLLADGALRLAGAYELLPASTLTKLGDDDSFRDILKDEGIFKNKADLSDPRVCLLLVIAFRDSFMHGEDPEKKQPRFKFRRKWFAGDFTSINPKIPYSPAIIAQSCQRVWEEIISLMT